MDSTSLAATPIGLVKVLLVDDVDLFVALEQTFFQREQFRILTASNGDEVLQLAKREKPDLVFLDLYLPGINGDVVCRQLKTDPVTASIPVIMVVQRGSSSDLNLCRAAHCDDIVYKPVRREDFLRASREQLSLIERLIPRFNARLLVHYGLREERLYQQYSVNLGIGGLFLATEAHLSIDTSLVLQIEIPDGVAPLCCRGRVAWLNHPDWIKKLKLPHGMGVEFLDISEAQKQRVANYLSRFDVS